MSDTLKTETVTFKNFFKTETLGPTTNEEFKHVDNFTIDQQKTMLLATQSVNNQIIHNSKLLNVEQNNKKTKKFIEQNPYHQYIPKFYLNELKNTSILFFVTMILFFSILITCITITTLVFTTWHAHVASPWVTLLFIVPFSLSLAQFIIQTNRFKNFRDESKTINFRESKVLSPNIQRLYKHLKTHHIDVNWMSCYLYFILLLIMLVDSIAVMFYQKSPFAGFSIADKRGDTTYLIVFWVSVATIIFAFLTHIITLVSSYLRHTNIENFYNYLICDPTEIKQIKTKKNRRDLVLFIIFTCSFVFIFWFAIRLIKSKKKTPLSVI